MTGQQESKGEMEPCHEKLGWRTKGKMDEGDQNCYKDSHHSFDRTRHPLLHHSDHSQDYDHHCYLHNPHHQVMRAEGAGGKWNRVMKRQGEVVSFKIIFNIVIIIVTTTILNILIN